jgi:hypothetical protein
LKSPGKPARFSIETGEIAFSRAGTFDFDNAAKLNPPTPAPEPVADPIHLEEPHVDIDLGE